MRPNCQRDKFHGGGLLTNPYQTSTGPQRGSVEQGMSHKRPSASTSWRILSRSASKRAKVHGGAVASPVVESTWIEAPYTRCRVKQESVPRDRHVWR